MNANHPITMIDIAFLGGCIWGFIVASVWSAFWKNGLEEKVISWMDSITKPKEQ